MKNGTTIETPTVKRDADDRDLSVVVACGVAGFVESIFQIVLSGASAPTGGLLKAGHCGAVEQER